MELHRCSHRDKTGKKEQCEATPSFPAQDAPAYKKAPATSRRVNRGRHLGDSPTERVSPWKWCQRQSVVVVVERLLCWCLRNVGGDFLSWRQRVMGREKEHNICPIPLYGIKQSLPWAFLYTLNGVSGTVLLSAPWCSLYVLLPLYVWVNPALYQWHHVTFTKRISELEWTGLETGSPKWAAHFSSIKSDIIIVLFLFVSLGYTQAIWPRVCFFYYSRMMKFSSLYRDPRVFALLLMLCSGL